MSFVLVMALLFSLSSALYEGMNIYKEKTRRNDIQRDFTEQMKEIDNASINTLENSTLYKIRIDSIQNALLDVCRTAWTLGKINGCANADTIPFTWRFLGTSIGYVPLDSVVNNALSAASSTFSCANPEQYESYLLLKGLGISTTSQIPDYYADLQINVDSIFSTTGYTDPCGFYEYFFEE